MLIGIDIGGTKCALTYGDALGNVIEKRRFETADVNGTLNKIIETAKELYALGDVTAVGISCGGPLDEKRGIIMSPPNLAGWDNIHITEMIEDALGVPCGIRNDANACAMAEYYFGAGRGTQNMVFMTFGTGLGAGIIANGKLVSGANGNAGELGHIRLSHFGPAGYGKSGSFEGFCSGTGIAELGRTFKQEAAQSGVRTDWEPIPADMARAARAGDVYAKKAFDTSGRMLGYGLSMVIDLLNPEKIIIGSVFARCYDLLTPAMNEIINVEALPASKNVCEICTPELGERIGDVAALAVAKEVHDELR